MGEPAIDLEYHAGGGTVLRAGEERNRLGDLISGHEPSDRLAGVQRCSLSVRIGRLSESRSTQGVYAVRG